MLDIVLTLSGFAAILVTTLFFFERRLYSMVDSIGDIFSAIVTEPKVSKAFGILGKNSGEARANRATVDALAGDILNGPKFGALKVGAQMLGIDLDTYIEEHGAMGTLTALQSIAGTLGIDVNQIMAGGLTEGLGSGPAGGERNPYL